MSRLTAKQLTDFSSLRFPLIRYLCGVLNRKPISDWSEQDHFVFAVSRCFEYSRFVPPTKGIEITNELRVLFNGKSALQILAPELAGDYEAIVSVDESVTYSAAFNEIRQRFIAERTELQTRENAKRIKNLSLQSSLGEAIYENNTDSVKSFLFEHLYDKDCDDTYRICIEDDFVKTKSSIVLTGYFASLRERNPAVFGIDPLKRILDKILSEKIAGFCQHDRQLFESYKDEFTRHSAQQHHSSPSVCSAQMLLGSRIRQRSEDRASESGHRNEL